ncbi:MAG TPA: hypothetical protein VFR86_17910 [Burkholderiaceae bacterium]|nr:hypothetical protein [Burkholderiaceae bacterium]
MLAALAREAVEAAALHGSRRLTFHHFWLLAWRRPARACEIDMHIEVRWGSGKTILEAGRIDMGGK